MRCLAFPADDRHGVLANVIYDLLLVKNNLADVPILSSTDVDFIVGDLCVSLVYCSSCGFLCFIFVCHMYTYDFHNK